jgi:ubiquinone/menaquinone biosynthesis C-methylase UbiE
VKAPPVREVELFDRDAVNFEECLQSPLGRLRTELIWTGLAPFLQQAATPHYVLDVGGGTGAFALRLAAQGQRVLLLDPARGMLDLATAKAKRILTGKARENLRVQQGTIMDLRPRQLKNSFTAVLCHNILEYAVGPQQILNRMRELIHEDGFVSVAAANRDAEPLRTAVHQQDPRAALQLVDKTVHPATLFGGYRRVYSLHELVAMLDEAGFSSVAVRGVRVACDFLSQDCLEQQDGWDAAFALEQTLIARTPHKYLARYLHLLARPRD